MKLKRIICISLIMIILINTLICPISLAYTFGPDKSSYLFNWQSISTVNSSTTIGTDLTSVTTTHTALQTIPIQVSKSGIYSISNIFGGNISSNYIISANKNEQVGTDGLNYRVPLPVATYGNNGQSTMKLSNYNNANQKNVGVYLEENRTYYISFVSEGGSSISKENLTQSATGQVFLKYVEPKSGDSVYETSISSMNYTAPGIEIVGTTFYSNVSIPGKDVGSSRTSDEAVLFQDKLGLYTTQEIISNDAINAELELANNANPNAQNASTFESMITAVVVFLCDGFRTAIGWAMGDATITIDELLFNNYPNIRLSFFSSTRIEGNENAYLAESGMLDSVDENGEIKQGSITKYFLLFRNIAIAVYLIMFLYMGVSILLHSTGKQKEKYKSKLTDWLKGVLILAMFTYVMKYTIVINDAIVEYVEEIKNKIDLPIELPTMTGIDSIEGSAMNIVNSDSGNGDLMETTRATALKTGRLAYAMIYLFLIKQLIGFVYMYFKRLIAVTFLIIIFPLVTISYAIDKIGDGKSQAFNSWFNEFVLNVFMQSFQAVNYIIVISIIFALNASATTTNVILMLIGLEYVSKGDELLRGMFTKMSGGGANSVTRNLSEATKTIATVAVAKKITSSITGLGKRYTNVVNKFSQTRDAYNEHIEMKYNEKLRRNAELNEQMNRSYFNPEWVATDNVSGNIDKLLADPGIFSGEEMRDAADRIYVAMNDPELRAKYNAKFASLSEDQQNELKDRLIRNRAITETVNENVGVNGPLTNLEINFNAGIILEIFRNGKKVEAIRAGRRTGTITAKEEKDYAMYKYLQEQKMVRTTADGRVEVVRDDSGREVTLAKFLARKVSERTSNNKATRVIDELQKFNGNVTGLDTSTDTGSKRVHPTQNGRLRVMDETPEEEQRRDALFNMNDNTSIDNDVRMQRKEAARVVSRIKEYSEAVNSGRVAGCSATEMMQLANKWKELANSEDEGVRNILGKLADSAEVLSTNSYVGFNLEQFETMASLSVISDKENLEGTEAQKLEMYNQAVQNIVEVSTGVRRVETENGIEFEEFESDSIARKMVHRAELDDMIQTFETEQVIDTRNYIRTGGTQEQKRNARAIQEQRIMYGNEYDALQRTSSHTAANLIRSGFEAVTATASAAAAPLNVAMGGTGSAMIAGATSDKLDPAKIGTGYITGAGLENATEKLFPGTVAAESSSNTVGTRLDNIIKKMGSGPTDERINEQLSARQTANNAARKNVEQFNERFMDDRRINDRNRR